MAQTRTKRGRSGSVPSSEKYIPLQILPSKKEKQAKEKKAANPSLYPTLFSATETKTSPNPSPFIGPMPGPTLAQLEGEIRKLTDPSEKQLQEKLLELLDYLKKCDAKQTKTGIPNKNAQLFLRETYGLLTTINGLKEVYQRRFKALVTQKAKPEEFAKLAQQMLVKQSLKLLEFEKNCKPASDISNYNAKIVACIIITAFFAILGAIGFGTLGFVLGGGALSAFTTLAGLTQGAIDGATVGLVLGTLITGVPAFAISQHFLFKPTKLSKHQNAIVSEAQKVLATQEREHNKFLTA